MSSSDEMASSGQEAMSSVRDGEYAILSKDGRLVSVNDDDDIVLGSKTEYRNTNIWEISKISGGKYQIINVGLRPCNLGWDEKDGAVLEDGDDEVEGTNHLWEIAPASENSGSWHIYPYGSKSNKTSRREGLCHTSEGSRRKKVSIMNVKKVEDFEGWKFMSAKDLRKELREERKRK